MRRYAAMLMMLLTLGVGQMWGDSYTFTAGTTIYYDFSDIPSGAVNYYNGSKSWSYSSERGIIAVTFSSNTFFDTNTLFAKTEYAGWDNDREAFKFKVPTSGQNCFKVERSGDGETCYWTTYGAYTVSYNANGAGSGSVPAVSGTYYASGTDVTLANNTGSLAKTGYSLTGWNTEADGSGVHYALGGTYSSISGDVELYAEWTPDWALYNSSTKLGDLTKNSDYNYSMNITFTAENSTNLHFYKNGSVEYHFGADDPTSGTGLTQAAGQMNWINVNNAQYASYKITVYSGNSGSSWNYSAQQKYTLTYNANGATSGSAPSSVEYDPNDAVTTANSTMTKTSFTLTGWNTQANGQGTHYGLNTSNAFNINSNMTLYAEWTPDVPSSACVAGDFGTANMTKTTAGSVATFTYTFYDKAAGTYNFYLKDCSSSTVLLKATTGITMSQTGCTSIANSGDGNNYFRVVAGSGGDFTITATYNTSTMTINMDVTRVDIDAIASPSWYMIGGPFNNNWKADNTSFPLNRRYRGISNVYYRVVNFGDGKKYFKLSDGSDAKCTNNTSSDTEIELEEPYELFTNTLKSFTINHDGAVYCVYDKTNNQFWVQNPATYYTITLANGSSGNVLDGTQGTVTLTENVYGNLATKQFASGETVNISISAKTGYKINNITLGETSVATGVDETTYSGYTTMPSGNATLTVTYTPIDYTIMLDKNDGASDGSVTATFNSTSTKSFTAVTRTGYNCTGYWTATSGGYKVVNTDGSLVTYSSNISDYLNSDGTWKKTTATTLYAQWTPKTYAITLDKKEGGADGTASVNYNATALTSISAPTKTGYHVEGYYGETGRTNKVADASGNLQSGVSGFTTGTAWTKDADATLYTEWAANTYSVSFNANGGDGSIDNQDFTYGVAQNLTSNNGSITRQDYFFDGWATSPGGDVAYADGASVSDLTSTHEGTYTLYAHWSHVPVVASVTATPASYNYVEEDITLNLSATSTYLAHPIVVFFVNDGVATYQVTAAAYGDGDDAVGTIGSDAAYTTVHKATFAVKAAGTYSVTAKLYEGELVDNFEGENTRGWAGDNLGDGSMTFAANPGRMAGNGSSKVMQVTRTSGEEWGGAIMLFVANTVEAKTTCDAAGSNDYAYIHARMKDATAATHLKNNDNSSDSNNADIEPSFTGDASADWRHVTYHNTHCSNNFLFFMIQRGDTENKTVYIDDVILSNNETWAPVKDEKNADVTADASEVVINQTYDISIVGGRVASDNSATSVKASADVTNPLAGTADVIGVDVPLGMKFVGWKLSTGISLKEGYALTDHAIQFYALGNGTVTAQYEKRNHVHVYFAAVPGWDHVYAYTWQNSKTSNENANYPGEELTVTSEYDGITYYYYGYYTEGTGLGDAAPGDAAWDRVIFNKGTGGHAYPESGWDKTKDLELVNGHFYHFADSESGSEYYYDWYVMGRWNGAATWNYTNPIDYTNTAIVRDLNTEKQSFKIYRASTNEWFKYDPDGDSADEEDVAVIGSAMTLTKGVANNNIFTPDTKAGYEFSLVKDNTSPTLTIQKMTDQDISVTVEAGANGSITTGTSTIHLYTTTTIEAAANAGYRFEKWTVDDAHKSYIHIEDTLSASTKVYAKYGSLGNGATITAHFTNKGFIYFDKTDVMSAWSGSDIYVTFFTNNDHWEQYDDDRYGKGKRVKMMNWVDGLHNQKMKRIGTSNIYYFDTEGKATQWFMFTDKDMPTENETTWSQAAVARGDFSSESGCNLFVPENYVERTVANTGYYYGYWMKYREEEAGVKVSIYDGSDQPLYGSPFAFTREDLSTNTFTTTVKLNGSTTYRIELLGDNGIYYKHNATYNTTNAGTYWDYVEREATVGYITTTGEGEYVFTLKCENKLNMATTYPLKSGDYRIVYNGKIYVGAPSKGDFNGSPIAKWTADTQIDKVSFFVTDESGSDMDWNLRVQSCSIAGSTVTWNDVDGKVFSFSGLDGKTGVYVFDVKQTSASDITIENPEVYTGDYYIRTDIADGRWEAYKEAENNKMVHSDWAEANCDYNYYHCHYTPSGKSVKFTIANDYSSSISGELNSDDYTTGDGKLNANANVRFSYNSATNVIKRTYIGGSIDDTYLNIVSPTAEYVYASNGTTDLNGASASTRKFIDMGNWVYQLDVQAYPTSQARVTAYYNGDTQYLIGSSTTSETIIGGADKGTKKYKLRVVYDFKNNHLITSWLADGNQIEENITLNADLMIVRHLQEAGVQITFDNNTHSVSGIKTIYGAIRFDYNDMVNTMPNWSASGIYGKLIYYISFPFDVNVKDIFGSAGNMEDQWIIQSYNGARRAKEGWFADSKPFWETLTVDSVMKAGRGYALIIDRPSFNDPSSVVWTNKSAGSSVYLYFPSHNADAATIGKDTKTVTVPPHKCNIQRSFYNSSSMLVSHTQTDSHWNMMGIPLFENKVASTVVADSAGFNYFYDWNAGTNSYEVMNTSITQFKAMHGYMVQFTGTVTFTGAALNPSVAARRLADNKKYLVELLMTNENDIHSRTYVELRENACDTFLLNEDVYMMRSSTTVDLFTLAGNYDVAANVLPIQNHTVPVGMDVKQAGMYTFSMPSNFSGTVTLLDTQAGTRTNLAISDYEVYLDRGTINNRFYLELNIQESTTSLEDINGEGSIKDGNAHKFLKNGVLYILKDGMVYDAKGNRVK